MTDAGTEFVTLRDEAGHYYLLPRTTVEAARVADDSVAQLEALLEEDDTAGHGIIAPQFGAGGIQSFGAQRFESRGIIVVGGYDALHAKGIIVVGGHTALR